MAWSGGLSIAGSGPATSLTELYVFDSLANAGKNLVDNSSVTAVAGGVSWGSDSIGTYAEMDAGTDYLYLPNTGQTFSDTGDLTIIIVFSREGTPPSNATLFAQDRTNTDVVHAIRCTFATTQTTVDLSWDGETVALDLSAITASTEYCLVLTRVGTTRKLFYTGGVSPISVPADTLIIGGTGRRLYIGNTVFENAAYPGRFRAYGYAGGTALSDSDAQSVADDPQQLVSAGAAPSAPSSITAGSITPTSASISWTDNSSDETGFKVRYAPSPYSSYTTATGSVAASPYVVTGLTDGTSYKAGVAAFNGNGDSTWVESGVFTTTALSKLRPSADTSAGSWSASSGSVLYSMIDETSADDADYISASSATTTKIKFESATDPADNGNHILRIRARSTSGTLTVRLVQGDPSETTIVSWVPTLTSSFGNYEYALSTAEASVITDYSALYLKLTTS